MTHDVWTLYSIARYTCILKKKCYIKTVWCVPPAILVFVVSLYRMRNNLCSDEHSEVEHNYISFRFEISSYFCRGILSNSVFGPYILFYAPFSFHRDFTHQTCSTTLLHLDCNIMLCINPNSLYFVFVDISMSTVEMII